MSPGPDSPLPRPPARPPEPWELALVRQQPAGSLVAVAREGRLTRECATAAVRVAVTVVDEAVLSLVDAAIRRGRNITFVYPSPAGEVSVLLAAQILIQKLIRHDTTGAVGVVTADPTAATRTWMQLGVATIGSRANPAEVFPCYRAGPNGEAPFGRDRFRGLLVGRRFANWPVDVLIVDHLAGLVEATATVPTVRIFADPTDTELERLSRAGELIWGWNEADIAMLDAAANGASHSSIPFSVSSERLRVIGLGVRTTLHVVPHSGAGQLIVRLRDDLRTLAQLAGPSPSQAVARAIRITWHHVSTLGSLPCRPSQFDRFAGLPPIAARATRTFGPEIAAWARTLDGDLREVADIVASDLDDLRSVLEEAPAFDELLMELQCSDAAVVVRTHTAARALEYSLRERDHRGWQAEIVAIRRLHRHGSYRRAIVVGAPALWDWHRLDSGLTADLHVATLSELDACAGSRALAALASARGRWADVASRARVWRELVGGDPPPLAETQARRAEVSIVSVRPVDVTRDPFEAFEPLLVSVPLFVGEEGLEESVAEQMGEEGEWQAAVEAVEVRTDAGVILLPRARYVDVRVGDEIEECRADELEAGMYLLVDRRGGRLGLLGAVADRLKQQRPDLLAANLLINDLRAAIQHAFMESRMTRSDLFRKLRSLGFDKTYATACSYVDTQGPLAPRDYEDLQRLNDALALGLSRRRVHEVFGAVMRWRTFRRAIGKSLVAASRDSMLAAHASRIASSSRIDPETGLSTADLRELVQEARVLDVKECPEPVRLGETGRFERR